MDRPLFVNNKLTRNILANRGINPDSPEGIETALAMQLPIGDQPDSGVKGNVLSFFQGAGRGLANTAIGAADLPLAIGRFTGETKRRLDPLPPTQTEQVNPNFSGAGETASFLASFLVPETFLGKLGIVKNTRAAGMLSDLGMSSERLIPLMMRQGGKVPDLPEIANFASSIANVSGGMKGGILSGLTPESMMSRAITGGPSFGILAGIQPGDIEDRVGKAATATIQGTIFSALGAPVGIGRGKSALREGLVGAATMFPEGSMLPSTSLPDMAQGGGFGAVLGFLTGGKMRGMEFPETSPMKKSSVRKEMLSSVIDERRIVGENTVTSKLPSLREIREVGRLPRSSEQTEFNLQDVLGTPKIGMKEKEIGAKKVFSFDTNTSLNSLIESSHEAQFPDDLVVRLYEEGIPKRINQRRQTQDLPLLDQWNFVEPSVYKRSSDFEARYGEAGKRFDSLMNELDLNARNIQELNSQYDLLRNEQRLRAIDSFEKQRSLIIEPVAEIINPRTGEILASSHIPRILVPSDLDVMIKSSEPGRLSYTLPLRGENVEDVIFKIKETSHIIGRMSEGEINRLSALTESNIRRDLEIREKLSEDGSSPTISLSLWEEYQLQKDKKESVEYLRSQKESTLRGYTDLSVKNAVSFLNDLCKTKGGKKISKRRGK